MNCEYTNELSRGLVHLANLVHPQLVIGCRAIQSGDEFALFPGEEGTNRRPVTSVRRATGTGRLVARRLLANVGSTSNLVRRGSSGDPQWPLGFVGSISHDQDFAVAAVIARTFADGLGIDIEPEVPLPTDLLEIVATPNERLKILGDMVAAKLLFCMKEAVFKATFPIDGVFLEHHDVEIDLDKMIARTPNRTELKLYTLRQPRLVALTIIN